jgi:hypothetical protein
MRKLVISLLAVFVLGAGSAFAQSGYWAGLSAGYPGAVVHFGVENVFPGLDVRANLGYQYLGVTGIGLGADVLYGLAVDTGTLPLDTYVGGGLQFGIGGGGSLGIGAFGGVEYRLGDVGLPEGGVFLEIGPSLGYRFAPGAGASNVRFDFIGRIGFNYHF